MHTFSQTIQSIGASLRSHSELKVDRKHLTVSRRDLEVEPDKYRFLKPSALDSRNYQKHLTSDLTQMDLNQPFLAVDCKKTAYLYIPA